MSTIEERYRKLHPKSAVRHQEAKTIFPDGVTHDARNQKPFPLNITHAVGSRKWDVDGNEYVDYFGGHGAIILGHSHPEINKAVIEQIGKGTQYAFSHDMEINWAKWVKKLVPSVEKIRFMASGTEATMMAVRLARAYTGKKQILKFKDHFNGWNEYGIAGAGRGMAGILPEALASVTILPANDIGAVEKTLQTGKYASVILEPTGAHLGSYPIRPSFLLELRRVTAHYGVVLIFDEVVTGFRTSRGGAQVRYGVTPDLTCFAKILGGGFPGAGAVGGKAELLNLIEENSDNPDARVAHPGTFNGNPVTAAAGSKCLELIATTPVNEQADAAAQRLKNGLNDLLVRMEIPGCATGVASIVQFRLGVAHECDKEMCILSDEEMKIAQDPKVLRPLQLALQSEKVGVHKGPTTHFVFASHTAKDINDTIATYEKALTALRKEGLL